MNTKKKVQLTLGSVISSIVLGVGVSSPLLFTSNISYAANVVGSNIKNNTQTQTEYQFGYEKPQPNPPEPENDEEAAMRAQYTPRDEKQLPERLSEYEMPERMDTELIQKMNDDIQTTVNALGKRLLNSEPTTKEIGSNKSNTQLLSNTIDMTEYFDMDALRLQEEKNKVTERYIKKEVTKEEIESQLESVVFPVKTSMKPTRMPASRMELSKDAKEAIPGTMIFIGMDEFSIEWFEMNLDEIRRFNPVGVFITQIDSVVDLRQLKRIAPDMNFIPTQSDEALKRFGVEFYPVMVTPEGIFQ